MNIEKAMRLPLVEGNFVKVVIGAVLNLIPVVSFLSAGFAVEAMGNAVKGKEEMPVWEDWGGKFIKGLVVWVISVIYMLLPLVIFLAGGGLGGNDGWGAGFILALLIGLVIYFFLPMAVAHYAATGSFGAAFSIGTVFSYIGAAIGSYLLAYILSIALFIALGIVAMIPLLGWIIGNLACFYLFCVLAFLFGDVYRQAAAARGAGAGVGA